jgi:hypothetical protein
MLAVARATMPAMLKWPGALNLKVSARPGALESFKTIPLATAENLI